MAEDIDALPTIEESTKKAHKMRVHDRIRVIMALTAAGKTPTEIAQKFGSTRTAISHVIMRQRNKIRDTDDPQAILDTKCKTQAVRNLDRILRDDKSPVHWQATRDTLYGTGMLKRHVNTKTEGGGAAQLPALTVNVVSLTPGEQREAPRELPDITVNAVGTPREL